MRRVIPWFLSLAVLSGCGAPGVEVHGATVPARVDALEGVVSVLDSGNWMHADSRYQQDYWFWVDLAVRNDTFHKTVGILWTKDQWQTVETAYAAYKGDLGGGYERWGMDVKAGVSTYPNFWRPEEVEYAAFAVMDGTTSWDPLNNYYIYGKVSRDAPVRRLSSEVHLEAGHGVVMTGRVRVFDLAFTKQVTVRYSFDNWQTSQDVDATWSHAEDWAFRVQDIPADPLPDHVEYAVRYTVNGQDYWDSANGANYRHALAPTFSSGYDQWDFTRPLSGVYLFYGTFATDLPSTGMDVRLDQQPWVPGQRLAFTTTSLTDGAHSVQFRLSFPSYAPVTHTLDFQVRNRLLPQQDWQPRITENGESRTWAALWDMARDAQGRLYFIGDNNQGMRVVRYAAFGTPEAPVLFDAVDAPLWTLTVAPSGLVYAVSPYDVQKALFRFTAEGRLDSSFGQAGRVSLVGPVDGAEICYAGNIASSSHHLYLLDTCNNRVVRLGLDGVLAGSVPLDGWSGSLFHDGTALWVISASTLYRLVDGPTQALAVDRTVQFPDTQFSSQGGLVRAGDGLFWSVQDGPGRVVVFREDGGVESTWSGGNSSDSAELGSFSSARGVTLLPDGSVAVLGSITGKLTRFSATLR